MPPLRGTRPQSRVKEIGYASQMDRNGFEERRRRQMKEKDV